MLKIASIGDVCVDIYPKEKQYFLGGTAFNRAVQLAKTGIRVSLVSAVGTDDWGKKYLAVCKRLRINTDYLSVIPGQTSHVNITLNRQKKPQFSAWQLGVLKNFVPKTWPQGQDCLITTGLTPIKQLLKLPAAAFRVADFDGDTPYTFKNVDIQKYAPNFDLIASSVCLKINHPMVLLTAGNQGSRLVTPHKEYFVPAVKIKTSNTTGAGDVYIATFVLNYLKTKNIPLSMKQATKAAADAITSPRNLGV
ncbi:carbohydrate kinase family protein [Patescibacteria group bacterium]|nr:carbohydrate kinase family protein [Patescibacteria group bacterium]